MTPEQIELARHALGLPNPKRCSYRNRFCADEGHDDYANWQDMVSKGWARRRSKERAMTVGDMFWLTRSGAALALQKGERLCPEDFPNSNASATADSRSAVSDGVNSNNPEGVNT